jgi:hypothetical protein
MNGESCVTRGLVIHTPHLTVLRLSNHGGYDERGTLLE